MTTERTPVDPARAYSAGSLFRCFRCGGNKHTQGRKQVFSRGVKVWICAECVAEREKAA